MASKKKYYAVARGRATGVFSRWFGAGGAEELVRSYPGARYKGFATLAEARAFLKTHQGKAPPRAPAGGKKKRRRPATAARVQSPVPLKPGQVVIYTDGGALNNPGPGGYGVVIVDNGQARELSAGFRLTTNNRMELLACIMGLSEFKQPTAVVLHSDSKYVINGITKGWAAKWRANDWMRTKRDPAVNPDLWERLLALCERHDVDFRWVKGHAGIAGNERCDALATRAASSANLAVDIVYETSVRTSGR